MSATESLPSSKDLSWYRKFGEEAEKACAMIEKIRAQQQLQELLIGVEEIRMANGGVSPLVALPVVSYISGLQKSAIYKRIADGNFPAPVKIGNANRWPMDEILEWRNNVVAERQAP